MSEYVKTERYIREVPGGYERVTVVRFRGEKPTGIPNKGYEVVTLVVNPAGDEVAGPFDTMEEAEQWVEDAEPWGAGADPFGRPDPQMHPEFWTE